jgi:serine phosphatase RsbU (regulator of sigma subunit)
MSLILRNKLLQILIFSFFLNPIKAQLHDKSYYLLDSLKKEKISKPDLETLEFFLKKYYKASTDTAKLGNLMELVENLNAEDLWPRYNLYVNKVAKQRIEKATNPALILFYKRILAQTINNIGFYEQNYTGNIRKAMDSYKQTEKIQNSIEDWSGLIITKSNIAVLLHNTGNTAKAIELYKEAISINDNNKLNANTSAVYNNLADVYSYIQDTVNAIVNLNKALEVAIRFKQKSMIAQELQNLGVVYNKKGKMDISFKYFKKSLELRNEIGDELGVCRSKINLANICINNNKIAEAKRYLEDVTGLVKSSENLQIKYLYHYSLGILNEKINQTKTAIDNYEKALNYAIQITNLVEEFNTLNVLAPLYEKEGNLHRVINSYKRIKEIELVLNRENLKRNLTRSQVEAELKENQRIRELEAEQRQAKQKLTIITVLILLLVFILFSYFISRALKKNKQMNTIILAQKAEVESQKELIEEKAHELAIKHKDITDSINYAQRIQSSLIPAQEEVNRIENKITLLFQPRDLVSGDFYWFTKFENKFLFALADCTGHGVPGAFMSIIGINHLHAIVNEKEITMPDQILNELKTRVISSLNIHNSDDSKSDGMDVALISVEGNQLLYSGANQSIYILRKQQELIQIKGDRQPVGFSETSQSFTLHAFELVAGDRVIMFTDGIVDQFGSEAESGFVEGGKKLKITTLKKWLLESSGIVLEQQKLYIQEKLNNFKLNFEQTDDISLAIYEY